MYCVHCGNEIDDKAFVCVKCGRLVNERQELRRESDDSSLKLAAGILGLFFGALGIHNFMLGRKGRGIAQLSIFICGLLLFFIPLVNLLLLYFVDVEPMLATIVLGILLIVADSIWALIDSVLILVKL